MLQHNIKDNHISNTNDATGNDDNNGNDTAIFHTKNCQTKNL